jgi:quercetin dioxygenase-like cupin family protein
MTRRLLPMLRHIVPAMAFVTMWPTVGRAQLIRCITDSPERRGEPGCAIVSDKRLPGPLRAPVLWHIDEFPTLADAQRAETPMSLAITAHGSAWLYSIGADTSNHHGGKHRAVVGPIPTRPNQLYSMMAMSAYFLPGQYSVVHTHPGPEAWWVLEGEQCLRTTRTMIRARAGQGAIVAEGDTMRMVGTGTGPRRALVLILHDADKPGGFTHDDALVLKNCT